MQLNKLLRHGKPQSSPFSLVSIVASHLPKFLEYLWLILGGDPDAGVTDRYLYRTICLPGVNSNPASFRGELHGIGKKIEKYLFNLALVADKVLTSLVNCNVQVDAVLCGPLAHKGARIVYRQREIERSNLQLHPPSLDFGEIENLI